MDCRCCDSVPALSTCIIRLSAPAHGGGGARRKTAQPQGPSGFGKGGMPGHNAQGGTKHRHTRDEATQNTDKQNGKRETLCRRAQGPLGPSRLSLSIRPAFDPSQNLSNVGSQKPPLASHTTPPSSLRLLGGAANEVVSAKTLSQVNSPKRLPCGLAAPAGCRRPKARRSSLRAGRLPDSPDV